MTINKKAAKIKKELVTLVTYPYADPSPIPEFGRLYPYNRFDGYTNKGYDQEWEMVVMENDYIKLWINPEVGGKVWGAIEKATNKEFIYFNHAAKFRDVAMRGPWTSGGMETNMGIIGHTPSCSSAVDHAMRTNADGSVSCFVGATDWPSKTTWTVEIRLPADSACFISRSSWYNNSGLEQSYYQWNNIGVKVTGNLEYVNPGYQTLGHDGRSFSWPNDEKGNEISFYNKNDFGEYKSYHIFGSYSDFWGCYWHDDDFGFGHYASYDDKPGKKVWIWGLSRYGMIWEDMLTDSDGQYTEVQSGRLFNQSIAASSKTPFKHSSFLPYTFDHWDEYWFPVKNIGGLKYGNEQLSFNLIQNNGTAQLHICAIKDLDQTIKIEYGDKPVTEALALNAMQQTVITLPDFTTTESLKIWLNENLIYNAGEQEHHLSRPVTIPATYDFDSVQAIYIQAKEWERQRFFERAIVQYQACLEKDPFYLEALTGLAGVRIRQAQYHKALKLLMTALSVNTYHPETNYLYGMVNLRLNKITDAKDGFSIAAQSLTYRAAAYTELAKIFFREQQYQKASAYLKKALTVNVNNKQALQLEVIICRVQGNAKQAKQLANELLQANPLDHLAGFELYQLKAIEADTFKAAISSELPYETYLELICFYYSLGLYDECLEILALSPEYAMVSVWQACLSHLQNSITNADHYISVAVTQQSEFVFPHREEDIAVLEWAASNYPSYKLKYYLTLGYLQMLRTDDALELLSACGNEPDFYAFYIVRANLHRQKDEAKYETDLRKAYQIAPTQWRTALQLSKYLGENEQWQEALDIVQAGYKKNTDNYYLGLQLARCLMEVSAFEDGIKLMNKLTVLPNEGASEGRNVWRETHLKAALQAIAKNNWQQAIHYVDEARQWPENMGVGKPYEVDERLENFLELYSLQQSNQPVPTRLVNSITGYRDNFPNTPYSSNDFLSIYLLEQNNQFEKAEQLLNNWSQHNASDLALQWSQAFLQGDKAKLNIVAAMQPKKQIPLPYEILFEDRSFPFVKQLYNQHVFNRVDKTINN